MQIPILDGIAIILFSSAWYTLHYEFGRDSQCIPLLVFSCDYISVGTPGIFSRNMSPLCLLIKIIYPHLSVGKYSGRQGLGTLEVKSYITVYCDNEFCNLLYHVPPFPAVLLEPRGGKSLLKVCSCIQQVSLKQPVVLAY